MTVLEKAIPGAEASSAAAGILGAGIECEHPGPLSELCQRSLALYPQFTRELHKITGLDTGYQEGGTLDLSFDAPTLRGRAQGRRAQIRAGEAKKLAKKELLELEPALSPELYGGLHYPGDARLTTTSFYRATHIAAVRAGVNFVTGTSVERVVLDENAENRARVRGVKLSAGPLLEADVVVIAAGSWTSLIDGLPLPKSAVLPARGQIVELRTQVPLLDRVVFGAGVYLVPRKDGQLLIGSTVEFVGYTKGVTARGVQELLTGALRLVPALAQAEMTGSWSNFRPFTSDHLPLIGDARVDGLILASGHHRNGILLAPITAQIVTSLALKRRIPFDLSPFDPLRVRAD